MNAYNSFLNVIAYHYEQAAIKHRGDGMKRLLKRSDCVDCWSRHKKYVRCIKSKVDLMHHCPECPYRVTV